MELAATRVEAISAPIRNILSGALKSPAAYSFVPVDVLPRIRVFVCGGLSCQYIGMF